LIVFAEYVEIFRKVKRVIRLHYLRLDNHNKAEFKYYPNEYSLHYLSIRFIILMLANHFQFLL
jgi:hypothetical protein